MRATVTPIPGARRAYGLPDPSPVGILIGLDGVPVLVREDGTAAAVLPGGWPRPGAAHATARAPLRARRAGCVPIYEQGARHIRHAEEAP